jgi:L-lactate utilization protein LutC
MVEDALHETCCHENLDYTWEPIETMQDEMEDKAPAVLEELDEQNRMISDQRESQNVFSRSSKNKTRR